MLIRMTRQELTAFTPCTSKLQVYTCPTRCHVTLAKNLVKIKQGMEIYFILTILAFNMTQHLLGQHRSIFGIYFTVGCAKAF